MSTTPSPPGASAAVPLELNDAITVSLPNSDSPLQGVVSHLGHVDFAPDHDDYVGVRLTGPSVGLGKNDGTVAGKRYFDAGNVPNTGLFVRWSSGRIARRNLTRLQELQLARELGIKVAPKKSSSTAGSSSAAKKTTTPAAARRAGPTTPATSGSRRTGAGATTTTPASSARNRRIEELRERRAASAALSSKSRAAASTATPSSRVKGDGSKPPPSSSRRTKTTAAAASDSDASAASSAAERSSSRGAVVAAPGDADEYREKYEAASEELRSKREEIDRLRSALAERERDAEEARNEAGAARGELERYREEVKDGEGGEEKRTSAEGNSDGGGGADEGSSSGAPAKTNFTQDYVDGILAEKADLEEKLKTELTRSLSDLTAVRSEWDAERSAREAEMSSLKDELVDSRARAASAERDLASLSERDATKQSRDAAHAVERARMGSEASSLRRRVEELEAAAGEADATLEELALDKEQLVEEREALFEEVEELKVDAETARIEAEEVRLELEEVRSKLEDAQQRREGAPSGDGGGVDTAPAGAGDGGGGGGGGGAGADADADAEDLARALSTQNARLREALVRLREQSSYEKMELSKDLRRAEAEASRAADLAGEVETSRDARRALEGEVRELKDMVDANAAYEEVVEELSERAAGLEDEVAALRGAVADMEEAAEIAAEMEEVQAEENKALMKDVEGRDTIIRNLEEAIKMQRRREAEFQRTVGNYRSVIDTLKQEKSALLALREGGEGEKSHLLAASQRALARAARLASDRAASRRRDADAAFDRVRAQSAAGLAVRLEALIPREEEFVASEVAAVRGELLLSGVAAKGSASLAALSEKFAKVLEAARAAASMAANEPVPDGVADEDAEPGGEVLRISDAASQRVATMVHQARFAGGAVDASADSILLLCLGQWPGGPLAPGGSAELGSAVVHPFVEVDAALSHQMRSLIEEGALSPHRTSLDALRESVRNARSALFSAPGGGDDAADDDEAIVPRDWTPPGWAVVRDATSAKFACLGAAAAVASAVCPMDADDDDDDASAGQSDRPAALPAVRALTGLMKTMDQICNEATRVSSRVGNLPAVGDEELLSVASERASSWSRLSSDLLESLASMLVGNDIDPGVVPKAERMASETLAAAIDLSSSLKAAKISSENGPDHHPLSPETDGPWESVVNFVRKATGGQETDEEYLNFQERARTIEQRIADAIANESKLSASAAKVASLEKTLSTRSKEVTMQNVRLAELEALLAKSAAAAGSPPVTPKKSPTVDRSSSEAVANLSEENKFLHEAMEVLQAQVHEYEAEIRTLKEGPRSSRKLSYAGPNKPKLGAPLDLDATLSKLGKDAGAEPGVAASAGGAAAATASLEASLFRPALQAARADAAAWRARAMSNALSDLPPLSVPVLPGRRAPGGESIQPQDGDELPHQRADDGSSFTELARCREELIMASAESRLVKASIAVVDLRSCERPVRHELAGSRRHPRVAESRMKLREQRRKDESCMARLNEASAAARLWLTRISGEADGVGDASSSWRGANSGERPGGTLMGKVILGGNDKDAVIPLVVGRTELRRLHSSLLQ